MLNRHVQGKGREYAYIVIYTQVQVALSADTTFQLCFFNKNFFSKTVPSWVLIVVLIVV